ncbi:MAG: exopolysaccharide biosynthesis protein [Methylotenera sp.]|nr:exopolysaccharide biosynthesis protein [Methylotenera sp.]
MNRYSELVTTLELFATQAETEPITFGEAIDKLDRSAYTFTGVLAILPFLQPMPLGFFALIGSAAFIALGLQLFRGEPLIVLPAKIRKVTSSLKIRLRLVRTCISIIDFCRHFAKPRLSFLVEGRLGQQFGGFIFTTVGVLLSIPLGGVVPFKNLFPSLAILFYCTGEIEHDGLMVMFALLCLVLTVIFYSLLIYIAWKFGAAAISHIFWK